MLAVDGASFLLLSQSQALLFEQEKKRAASDHSFVSATVQNTVTVTRLQRGQTRLSVTDTTIAATTAIQTQKKGQVGASLYQDGQRVASTGTLSSEREESVMQEAMEGNPSLQLTESGGKSFLLAASRIVLERTPYILVTVTDATEMARLRDKQLHDVRLFSLLFSLTIAVILLIMVWWLTRPLQKINTAVRQIAQGNYRRRVWLRGKGELAELAHNLNRMAAAIEENVDSLEQVADAQKTFIANLAHEMKTPLTSILGFGDILRVKKKVTDEERRDYAGVIVEETKRLRALSGKLLELITMGNAKLDFAEISLPGLVQEVELSLQPVLAARQMTLVCDVPAVTITADAELFKSLLYNLADNAMKASKSGQAIEIRGGYTAEGRLRLMVADKGIGIPQKEIAKITQPFYMLDKARSRKAGGAGLGLALCVEIARLHGADLTIESKVGKGTCVFVTFAGKEVRT